MLKEGEELLFIHPLPPTRAERLQIIKEGCEKVLVDLQNLVEKYESLGAQSKRTWDRMRWGNEDIAEIRARLTSNISLLAAFISTSQVSVETKLDKFIEEYRQGYKETSIVSLQTVDSLSADDRVIWRTIRKGLEDIGISVAAFDANRDFIFDWFIRAVEAGAFQEQNADITNDESNCNDNQERKSNEKLLGDDVGRQIEHTGIESLESINEDQSLAQPRSSPSVHDAEPHLPKNDHITFDQIIASSQTRPEIKRSFPHVASLLTGLSGSQKRLLRAIATGNFSKALKILNDESSFHLFDTKTLDRSLWSATCQATTSDSYPLIVKLIARGGNVNYVSSDIKERTPLWNCVTNESFDIVRLLVENGANVNYKGTDRPQRYYLKGRACDFAPRAALRINPAILRLLISSGVDINVRFTPTEDDGRWFATDPPLASRSNEICLIHEAASLGAVSALESLLENGAEIDAASPRCGTALMIALLEGQEHAARCLLEKGANPNFEAAKNKEFLTIKGVPYKSPIDAAIISRRPSMVKLLLSWDVVADESTWTCVTDMIALRAAVGHDSFTQDDWRIKELLLSAIERWKIKYHPL